ncbi:MAG: MBL fold metallo-hydrolase [Candidatus Helarchaeota archaeon]|nr:MBL fold metallo-hydrolase [Candidatus Helarchaeota archaeon]
MKIKWITHACFQITTDDNKIIYTDPYQIKSGDPADIILVSHDHYDHADKKSIKTIFTDKTKVICPTSSAAKLGKFNASALDPNESTEVSGIKITTVPAYNPNKQFHPKGNNWVGFIIETGGKRIYHAGDTDVIPEMKELGEIDVALLPVGDNYTMGFSDAVEACKIIKPAVCIPMHDWNKDLNEFSRMVNEAVSSVKVEILKGKDLDI